MGNTREEPAFWMVWNLCGQMPRVSHSTLKSATIEAQRLARLSPGQRFAVLQAVKSFELAPSPLVETMYEYDGVGLAAPQIHVSKQIAVIEVVRSLPDAYRETLVLRLVEGMTGQEIADRTGMTPASVRVNLHRGMRLLRDRLQR